MNYETNFNAYNFIFFLNTAFGQETVEAEFDTIFHFQFESLVKEFSKEQVGMNDTLGYKENLFSRKEIFVVKDADVIIAISEGRLSDSQPDIADLGIIVSRDFQGKGIVTQVMQMLVNRVLKATRRPICSTTLQNIASGKVIEKSGFYCSNVIFNISFDDN